MRAIFCQYVSGFDPDPGASPVGATGEMDNENLLEGCPATGVDPGAAAAGAARATKKAVVFTAAADRLASLSSVASTNRPVSSERATWAAETSPWSMSTVEAQPPFFAPG